MTQFYTDLLLTHERLMRPSPCRGLEAACITETQPGGGQTGRGATFSQLIVLAEGPRDMHDCLYFRNTLTG